MNLPRLHRKHRLQTHVANPPMKLAKTVVDERSNNRWPVSHPMVPQQKVKQPCSYSLLNPYSFVRYASSGATNCLMRCANESVPPDH